MLSTLIENKPIFYYDGADPVVSYLKRGILFGYQNWMDLRSLIIQEDRDSYIVDCGAHVGTFSFVPALFDNLNMILIEGAKDNYDCLYNTFALKDNVVIHHSIVLDSVGACDFTQQYGPFGYATALPEGSRKSTTLDVLLKDKKISAIKLDIEGNEPEALMGAYEVLSKNKPPMLIEINGHCLRMQNKAPIDIFNQLDILGYLYFILMKNKTLARIDKNMSYPFCVNDIVAIHRNNISDYIGSYTFIPGMTQEQMLAIYAENYKNSNEDCQKYLKSLMGGLLIRLIPDIGNAT